MRFLIDAQLPLRLARNLTAAGHPSEHAFDVGLAGATDAEIWLEAQRRKMAVMTKDSDFAELTKQKKSGPPIVWIRRGNARSDVLWAVLEPLLPEIVAAIEGGERLIEIA